MPMKTSAGEPGELRPDIVTDKIIFIGPAFSVEIISELKNGVLGIVSYVEQDYLGFDIPGGNVGVDLIIVASGKGIVPTTPVALKLVNGKLYVYLSKYLSKVNIIFLSWNTLQIPNIVKSWFPQYVPLQIIAIEKTGAYEKHTSYCCNPPKIEISYYYRLFLTSCSNPYNPPTEYDVTIELMVPDYLCEKLEALASNKDFIWLGLNGDNQIYLWLSP